MQSPQSPVVLAALVADRRTRFEASARKGRLLKSVRRATTAPAPTPVATAVSRPVVVPAPPATSPAGRTPAGDAPRRAA